VIAHIVLFTPRPDLTAAARVELVASFEAALREIPAIRRARIGRRLLHGRPYEALMSVDYQYAAVLEFDDLEQLKLYLEHPAHARLAERFFSAFEHALMYDYEMAAAPELATWARSS
jgi:hypothetical protein